MRDAGGDHRDEHLPAAVPANADQPGLDVVEFVGPEWDGELGRQLGRGPDRGLEAADGVVEEGAGGVEWARESRRRRWEEMDALRARMVREGYELDGLDARERERVWRSLAGGTRRAQLLQLLGITEGELHALIGRVRIGRAQVSGRR